MITNLSNDEMILCQTILFSEGNITQVNTIFTFKYRQITVRVVRVRVEINGYHTMLKRRMKCLPPNLKNSLTHNIANPLPLILSGASAENRDIVRRYSGLFQAMLTAAYRVHKGLHNTDQYLLH